MKATALDRLHWALDPCELASALNYALDGWQQTLICGKGNWLANCGRQVGKSTVAEVKALHTAIRHAGSLSLIVAPSKRQSEEVFARVAMAPGHLGIGVRELNKSAMTLDNRSRVVALPGTSATVRGFSKVALVVVDEAAFVEPELFAAVRPMLAVSGGNMLVTSTPFLDGDFFDREWKEGQGWQRCQVLSEECPRISAEFLAAERAAMPPVMYAREYECVPMTSANLLFREEVLNKMFAPDEVPLGFQWGSAA